MKLTCDQCKAKITVPDDTILKAVARDNNLRAKVSSLLGKLTGGKTKLDAEGRRQRALKAVQAREAKRAIGSRRSEV